MKLYILASGKDKKGTQLEYLTKIILESLGYEYVSTNHISVGGDEIDVYAKRVFQSVGKMIEYPLVCECKAHEAPITMNDWLKFQGKVHKQKNNNSATQGLMIALSDANGNVKGDYEQTKYDDIQLIQGNDLIQPLSKAFSLEEENIAREEVSKLTKKTVSSVDLVLYNNEIYWLFSFANEEFSVFDKNYNSLSPDVKNALIPLLAQYSPYQPSSYKNVREEYELIQRRDYVKLVVCWHLMKGKMTFQEAVSDVVCITRGCIVPELKDVKEVVPTISFANVDVAKQTITLKSSKEIDYLEFYHLLLDGPALPFFLYDDYYQQHIDESLLEKILDIQHILTLSPEDCESCLFILRHSPNALRYAIRPQKMVQAKAFVDQSNGGKSARDYFIEELLFFLDQDSRGPCREMTFYKLGLRDFQKFISVKLVSKTGEEKNISTKHRIFFSRLEEGDGDIMYASDSFFGKYNKDKDSVIEV